MASSCTAFALDDDTVGRNRFAGADQRIAGMKTGSNDLLGFPARRIIAQPLGQRQASTASASVTPTAFWRAAFRRTAASRKKTNIVTESEIDLAGCRNGGPDACGESGTDPSATGTSMPTRNRRRSRQALRKNGAAE